MRKRRESRSGSERDRQHVAGIWYQGIRRTGKPLKKLMPLLQRDSDTHYPGRLPSSSRLARRKKGQRKDDVARQRVVVLPRSLPRKREVRPSICSIPSSKRSCHVSSLAIYYIKSCSGPSVFAVARKTPDGGPSRAPRATRHRESRRISEEIETSL